MKSLLIVIITTIAIVLLVTMSLTSSYLQNSSLRPPMMKSTVRTLSMKGKGKKVPINQRGEYIKQQRMVDLQAQALKNKPTGVPVFKVFVRPKSGGLWLPCGDLAGDSRATALVNAWLSGFMSDMYKGQMDQGVARSIFSQEESFVRNIIENFKPFKKSKPEDLQFGYKVEFEGVEAKYPDLKVTLLEKGMEKGWFDKLKDSWTGILSNTDSGDSKA